MPLASPYVVLSLLYASSLPTTLTLDPLFTTWQIVSIRAETESLEIEEEALVALGEIGEFT